MAARTLHDISHSYNPAYLNRIRSANQALLSLLPVPLLTQDARKKNLTDPPAPIAESWGYRFASDLASKKKKKLSDNKKEEKKVQEPRTG